MNKIHIYYLHYLFRNFETFMIRRGKKDRYKNIKLQKFNIYNSISI